MRDALAVLSESLPDEPEAPDPMTLPPTEFGFVLTVSATPTETAAAATTVRGVESIPEAETPTQAMDAVFADWSEEAVRVRHSPRRRCRFLPFLQSRMEGPSGSVLASAFLASLAWQHPYHSADDGRTFPKTSGLAAVRATTAASVR